MRLRHDEIVASRGHSGMLGMNDHASPATSPLDRESGTDRVAPATDDEIGPGRPERIAVRCRAENTGRPETGRKPGPGPGRPNPDKPW